MYLTFLIFANWFSFGFVLPNYSTRSSFTVTVNLSKLWVCAGFKGLLRESFIEGIELESELSSYGMLLLKEDFNLLYLSIYKAGH